MYPVKVYQNPNPLAYSISSIRLLAVVINVYPFWLPLGCCNSCVLVLLCSCVLQFCNFPNLDPRSHQETWSFEVLQGGPSQWAHQGRTETSQLFPAHVLFRKASILCYSTETSQSECKDFLSHVRLLFKSSPPQIRIIRKKLLCDCITGSSSQE